MHTQDKLHACDILHACACDKYVIHKLDKLHACDILHAYACDKYVIHKLARQAMYMHVTFYMPVHVTSMSYTS